MCSGTSYNQELRKQLRWLDEEIYKPHPNLQYMRSLVDDVRAIVSKSDVKMKKVARTKVVKSSDALR